LRAIAHMMTITVFCLIIGIAPLYVMYGLIDKATLQKTN